MKKKDEPLGGKYSKVRGGGGGKSRRILSIRSPSKKRKGVRKGNNRQFPFGSKHKEHYRKYECNPEGKVKLFEGWGTFGQSIGWTPQRHLGGEKNVRGKTPRGTRPKIDKETFVPEWSWMKKNPKGRQSLEGFTRIRAIQRGGFKRGRNGGGASNIVGSSLWGKQTQF